MMSTHGSTIRLFERYQWHAVHAVTVLGSQYIAGGCLMVSRSKGKRNE